MPSAVPKVSVLLASVFERSLGNDFMTKQNEQDARVTLQVPQQIYQPAKAKAKTEHISLNSLIVRLLEREIAQKGKQK